MEVFGCISYRLEALEGGPVLVAEGVGQLPLADMGLYANWMS